MVKFEATKINHSGQKQVEDWLVNNGFNNVVHNDIEVGGIKGIEANGNLENILVYVRAALLPDLPSKIKPDEKATIKEIAEKQERKAYVAYLVIGDDHLVVGEISWERLG